ncbi:uracil DNA glycosylase superfamily protein [bacterium BMS3Abin05]|nr:uracil DNA glycosylase superfamily protein [bacterium BMS3Abin05]GBE27326.1 uracil DNA glycosylase superfamily protein [bacterium BMS3Bbin03]
MAELQQVLSTFLDYLKQQKQLFGDGFLMTGEEADELIQTFQKKELTLNEFYEAIKDCRRCPLAETRTHLVFGTGDEKADLMLIGEAPGRDEDLSGIPFVGRAGQLLNKILEAVHFKRDEVYIANIIKCRPPQNRDPLLSEVEQCEPYLKKQIDIIKPKFILALGRIAGQTLLRSGASLTALRGKVHNYHGIKLIVTYHPAALLRNPQWKRPTWEDVQFLRKLYDEEIQYGTNAKKL